MRVKKKQDDGTGECRSVDEQWISGIATEKQDGGVSIRYKSTVKKGKVKASVNNCTPWESIYLAPVTMTPSATHIYFSGSGSNVSRNNSGALDNVPIHCSSSVHFE